MGFHRPCLHQQHENMNEKFHALFKLALIETDYTSTVFWGEKMTSAPILAVAEQMILGIQVFQSFLEFLFHPYSLWRED